MRLSDAAEAVVTLRRVTVGYGDRPVLRDVDLVLRRGEVMALVGPNGSGKTTLVRGVLGLARVLSGEIELLGVPSSRFRERWRVGYVPQRHTVGGAIPSTVEEVVASGRLPRKRLVSRRTAADRDAVAGALGTVGLLDQRRAPVSTLSGGQQRRVLIARALAGEPEVLVMDEPTAGVDAASQGALARTLTRLVEHGLTLLVVTHETAPLRGLFTREVTVQGGRITRDRALGPGTPEDGLDWDDGHHHPGDRAAGTPGWLADPGLGR